MVAAESNLVTFRQGALSGSIVARGRRRGAVRAASRRAVLGRGQGRHPGAPVGPARSGPAAALGCRGGGRQHRGVDPAGAGGAARRQRVVGRRQRRGRAPAAGELLGVERFVGRTWVRAGRWSRHTPRARALGRSAQGRFSPGRSTPSSTGGPNCESRSTLPRRVTGGRRCGQSRSIRPARRASRCAGSSGSFEGPDRGPFYPGHSDDRRSPRDGWAGHRPRAGRRHAA
jgi:hypothetical protein